MWLASMRAGHLARGPVAATRCLWINACWIREVPSWNEHATFDASITEHQNIVSLDGLGVGRICTSEGPTSKYVRFLLELCRWRLDYQCKGFFFLGNDVAPL